jgi:hypothetical protein
LLEESLRAGKRGKEAPPLRYGDHLIAPRDDDGDRAAERGEIADRHEAVAQQERGEKREVVARDRRQVGVGVTRRIP